MRKHAHVALFLFRFPPYSPILLPCYGDVLIIFTYIFSPACVEGVYLGV
jgi:hypothetical protein